MLPEGTGKELSSGGPFMYIWNDWFYHSHIIDFLRQTY